MKTYLILLMSLFASQSMSAQYACKDYQTNNVSYLTLQSSQVLWEEMFHSASSRGTDMGFESQRFINPL